MRLLVLVGLCLVVGVAGLIGQTRAGTLDIYFIDTEGGQSTLYVGPTGESLLVDSGNAGDRDLVSGFLAQDDTDADRPHFPRKVLGAPHEVADRHEADAQHQARQDARHE